ncbi:MAG: helix-turn-helix domain-containing protein [Elusimicrobiota bacterium]|nr:helix-turn-helix domain-containing protein [Elusimicrobiota bacterium]
MEKSLKEFKEYYKSKINELLWSQWASLGVSGYGESPAGRPLDPEALLLFTAKMARYDARLFDEVMDWVNLNSYAVNVQRLKSITRKKKFGGEGPLGAAADYLNKKHGIRKLKGISKQKKESGEKEDLFYFNGEKEINHFGKAEPVFDSHGYRRGKVELRGNSGNIPLSSEAGLLCRIRYLFGVNARCEIILYLLTHESGHPSGIAGETYYSQKAVQDTLVEMAKSGIVHIRKDKREKYYYIEQERWKEFLGIKGKNLEWINWVLLFSAFEKIWDTISSPKLARQDRKVQSSELRALMAFVKNDIERSNLSIRISDRRRYLPEEYPKVFMDDIGRILKKGI